MDTLLRDCFFLLAVIAVEIPVCTAFLVWVVWREIVPPTEPYFPPEGHQHKQQLSCGDFDFPYVIYPHGQSACRACYEKKGNLVAS